jgi:hypothetical protein
MTEWWKPKNDQNNADPQARREELIKSARETAEKTREAIGREKLSKLREVIEGAEKPKIVDPPPEPSPMLQAQEILKKIDHTKMLHFLRTLREKNNIH